MDGYKAHPALRVSRDDLNHRHSLLYRTVQLALDGIDDVLHLWDGMKLQLSSVGHRDVCTCNTLDWGIQVVKRARLKDRRGDFCTNAVLWPALLHGDEMVGLVHRLDNGLTVKRADRPQVDHLAAD